MADYLKKKKIGLFGGSFNPIHIGHLNLACELREKGGLDEIWFIPVAISPFKQNENLLPAPLRYKMVALALERSKDFFLIDDEMRRGGVSYTIDTLRAIFAQKKENESFTLCLGEDSLATFHQWKEYREILEIVPILVGLRPSVGKEKQVFFEKIANSFGVNKVVTTLFEISASYVRERLQKRLFCDHLVPQKVLDFIYENQLYFNE